ncbi:Mu-like prophage major head subunit gpT family protein [Palleronia rufa]|uniref:Mu-like prophage major head subunit gpT family protein n=1 Tax=Palleronia rufa TaxID=1530186 RepID=UPI00126923BC
MRASGRGISASPRRPRARVRNDVSARTAMRRPRGGKGRIPSVTPNTVVVPPELEDDALHVLDTELTETGGRWRTAPAMPGPGWIRFQPRKATAEPVVTPLPAGRPWPPRPPSAKRSACRTARRGPGPSTSSRSARLPCRPTNRAKT